MLNESVRAIDGRNAFIMGALLQEVTRAGTAAKAQATLKRNYLSQRNGASTGDATNKTAA